MPRLITKVLRANEFWVFLVIFALTLVIQARSGQFYTPNNLSTWRAPWWSPGRLRRRRAPRPGLRRD